MEVSFLNMQRIYELNTEVRIKSTGEYARIIERCWCCCALPLHYNIWVFRRLEQLGVAFQDELELVPEPTPEEKQKTIDTLAEVIVNVIWKELEEESREAKK